MTIVIVNTGERGLLEHGLGVALELRLHTTDLTGLAPVELDDLTTGDLDEPTFTGYTPVALPAAGWSITIGNPTEARQPPAVFTCSADLPGPELVRGYHVVRQADGVLMWLEQWPGPITVEFADDEIHLTPTITLDDAQGHDMPTGAIIPWPTDTPPAGWLLCDGSAVSRTQYANLFAVIGETWGEGDGSTTFNVPDLRGRFPLGRAQSGTGSVLGETGGALDHTHGLDHQGAGAAIAWGAQANPLRMRRRTGGGTVTFDANVATTQNAWALTGDTSSDLANTIALVGQTMSANPPYAVVHYIIKT